MSEQKCSTCTFRARYDNNPKSILGRIWRWHIKFCPGWKQYLNSMTEDEKVEIIKQYRIIK